VSTFSIELYSQTLPPPPQNISDGLQQLLDNALPGNFSNPGAVLGVVMPGQWAWYGATGNAISGTTSGWEYHKIDGFDVYSQVRRRWNVEY